MKYPSIKYLWIFVDKLALIQTSPDSLVYRANMGPTWALSAPDVPHAGPMNLAISEALALVW